MNLREKGAVRAYADRHVFANIADRQNPQRPVQGNRNGQVEPHERKTEDEPGIDGTALCRFFPSVEAGYALSDFRAVLLNPAPFLVVGEQIPVLLAVSRDRKVVVVVGPTISSPAWT
jgi:hypothetical protein